MRLARESVTLIFTFSAARVRQHLERSLSPPVVWVKLEVMHIAPLLLRGQKRKPLYDSVRRISPGAMKVSDGSS